MFTGASRIFLLVAAAAVVVVVCVSWTHHVKASEQTLAWHDNITAERCCPRELFASRGLAASAILSSCAP